MHVRERWASQIPTVTLKAGSSAPAEGQRVSSSVCLWFCVQHCSRVIAEDNSGTDPTNKMS